MAAVMGMLLATYRRLEQEQMANPLLRDLVNCALALGVELDNMIEGEWRALDAPQRRARASPRVNSLSRHAEMPRRLCTAPVDAGQLTRVSRCYVARAITPDASTPWRRPLRSRARAPAS